MKFSKFEFEGTPEEFKTVSPFFTHSTGVKKEESVKEEPSVDPVEAVLSMLERISIPDGQLALYKALGEEKLEYGEFVERTGRRRSQMAGILGALGRRINNTEKIHKAGLPGNCDAVLEQTRKDGVWYIELKPHTIEALKTKGII